MLCSPAEPKDFLVLGDYSSLPETYGADFLAFPLGKTVGIQRKECSDLIASIRGSDRLAREMAQMKELDRAVLIIEGNWKWGLDGASTRRGCEGFLRSQLDGIVLSAQVNGILVLHSASIANTIEMLPRVEAFFTKETHLSLFRRPKARGLWGTHYDKDWSVHFLQGFEGMGTGNAGALYDALGLPLAWTVTEKDLLSVKGLGKGRVGKLWRALPHGGVGRELEGSGAG